MHFCLICIYSIKYLISGKCDLDPVAKPQQASNHTIVLVRVKPSKICHIARLGVTQQLNNMPKYTQTFMLTWEQVAHDIIEWESKYKLARMIFRIQV